MFFLEKLRRASTNLSKWYLCFFYLGLVLSISHCAAEPNNRVMVEEETEKELVKPKKLVAFEKVKSMTPEKIHSLDEEIDPQFENISSWNLKELSFDQLDELFRQILLHGDLQKITPEQISSLHMEQMQRKKPSGVWDVSIDNYIQHFSLDQVKAFRLEQLKAMGKDSMAYRMFTPEQIAVLSLEQLKAFGFKNLITPYVRVLSPKIIQSIPLEVMRDFKDYINITLLTFEQTRALTPEQIYALNYRIKRQLTPEHIRWMTPEQVKAIYYYDKGLQRGGIAMTTSQVQVLSKEQIQTFDSDREWRLEGEHIESFTYEQMHSFPEGTYFKWASDQIGFRYYEPHEITDKNAEIQYFKPEEFYDMTYKQGAMMLMSLLLYDLSPERIRAMPYFIEYIKTEDDFLELSEDKVRAIPPDHFSRLTDEQFEWFFSSYRKKIDRHSSWQELGTEDIVPRIRLLTSEQIASLSEKHFDEIMCLRIVSSAQIYGLPLEKINKAISIIKGDHKVKETSPYDKENPFKDCTARYLGGNRDPLEFIEKLEKRKLQLETGTVERSKLKPGEVLHLCNKTRVVQEELEENVRFQVALFPHYFRYYSHNNTTDCTDIDDPDLSVKECMEDSLFQDKQRDRKCANITEQHLLAVKHLYLHWKPSYEYIEILPDGELSGFTALEELFLQDNKLYTLNVDDFRDLKSLKVLHLNNNELQELPAGVFDPLVNLEELLLYNNQLETLPRGLFSKMKKLKRLALYNNQFSVKEKERIIEELQAGGIELEVPAFIKERMSYGEYKHDQKEWEAMRKKYPPIMVEGKVMKNRGVQ